MSITTRTLTPDEMRAFRTARLAALEAMPYFAHGLLNTHPLATEGLGTLAVDAHWRLYIDPELLTGDTAWPVGGLAAGLLHETGHLLREHAARAAALPHPVDHLRNNLATDAEVNDDLAAAGVAFPIEPVTPTGLGLTPGELAETYYHQLTPQHPEAGPDDPDPAGDSGGGGDSDHGCGSGAGDPPGGWELPPDDPGAPAVSAAEGELIRRRVADDIRRREQAGGRGTVPAELTRWAEHTLAPPTVNWRRVLAAAVRRQVASVSGRVDYTYRRPSRRRVPGVVKPAMRGTQVNAAVVIDTSASMGGDQLAAALSEVTGVLSATGVNRDTLRVLACDAAADTPRRVRSAADVELTGGGGTDMRAGLAAAEATRPRPDVVIVLTDGLTPWPDAPPRARVIVGVLGSEKAAEHAPAWATVVPIHPH